eukprot:12170226-Alexandrium_andersonii.AAC.1
MRRSHGESSSETRGPPIPCSKSPTTRKGFGRTLRDNSKGSRTSVSCSKLLVATSSSFKPSCPGC